jgi:hypothetical protein
MKNENENFRKNFMSAIHLFHACCLNSTKEVSANKFQSVKSVCKLFILQKVSANFHSAKRVCKLSFCANIHSAESVCKLFILKHFSFCRKVLKTFNASTAISTKITIATIKCNQKSITIAAAVVIVNYNVIAIVAKFSNCSMINTINLGERLGLCGGFPPLPTQILHLSHLFHLNLIYFF